MPSHAVAEEATASRAGEVGDGGTSESSRRPAAGCSTGPDRAARAGSWWWTVPVVAPLLVFVEGLTFKTFLAPQEAARFNFPLHVLVGRLWREGTVPVWNEWSFSGSPLLASGQAGVFYPVNLAYVVLPPVVANNLAVIAGFVLAGLGAFLLGRHLTSDPAAGAVTAVAFAFSAFFFAHLPHQAVLGSATWLPWIFYGFERLRERVTPGRVAFAGGAVALAFLGGHSQLAAISVMALGVYALLLLLFNSAGDRPRRTATAVAAALAVVVGLGLSAPQWLPSLRVLDATDRAELPFEVATTYSLTPSHLPLLAFPYLFGGGSANAPFTAGYQGDWNLTELSAYPGLAAFVLAAVGLVAARRDRRVWALVVLAVLAVLAALGGSTPLGRGIYALPVYGQFRSWGRFGIVLILVVAVLAGYGVAALRRRAAAARTAAAGVEPGLPPARGKVLAATALVTATGLAVLALVVDTIGPVAEHLPDDGPHVLARALPVAAALLAAGLVAVAIGRRRLTTVTVGALCAVVLADAVFSFGWELAWRDAIVPSPDEAAASVEVSAPPEWGPVSNADGGVDRFFIAGTRLGGIDGYPQLNAAQQLRSVNGFDPLAPADYLAAASTMAYAGGVEKVRPFWQPGSHLLDLLRVTTVLASPAPLEPRPYPDDPLTGGRSVAGDTVVRYDRLPALPDAYVVNATRPAGRVETLGAITGEAPFDPGGEALVEPGGCGGCPGPQRPGRAGTAVRRSDPGTIEVEVEVTSGAQAFLVVSEAWFPGWRASVDGRPAEVVRADGLLLGVGVPPGRHAVRFDYRAPGLRTGVELAALTVLLLAAWAAFDRQRRRRGAAGHPHR